MENVQDRLPHVRVQRRRIFSQGNHTANKRTRKTKDKQARHIKVGSIDSARNLNIAKQPLTRLTMKILIESLSLVHTNDVNKSLNIVHHWFILKDFPGAKTGRLALNSIESYLRLHFQNVRSLQVKAETTCHKKTLHLNS